MASSLHPISSSIMSREVEKNSKIVVNSSSKTSSKLMVVDVILRVFLFATALTSVVALLTSKQTAMIPLPFPPYRTIRTGRYTHSPALIYSSAALWVTCIYSIITTIISFFVLMKRSATSTKLMTCVFVIDVLLLGIVASASGAAGEAAYLGYKGNSHTQWHKICKVYDKYCRHVGLSVLTSTFASVALLLLIILTFSRITTHKN